jgi:hypothetical protein
MQQVVNIAMSKVGEPAPVAVPPAVIPVPAVVTPVTLNFTCTCVNKSNFELRPSLYLFYRQSGTGAAFQYLGYMDKGSITSSILSMGTTYDFEITYAGVNYIVTEKLQQAVYNEQIALGDVCNNF